MKGFMIGLTILLLVALTEGALIKAWSEHRAEWRETRETEAYSQSNLPVFFYEKHRHQQASK